jgi:hypothetical protein
MEYNHHNLDLLIIILDLTDDDILELSHISLNSLEKFLYGAYLTMSEIMDFKSKQMYIEKLKDL